MGVNTSQLNSILLTKLIIDDRRPNTLHQTGRRKSKPVKGATLGTMLLSAVMGAFFLICFSIGKDYTTHLTVYFSMYIFLLASSLISDFTSVLIDVRDNYIILPKPVTDRTVLVGRLLHIIIHVSKIVLPMSMPAIIFIGYNKNIWAALLFFVLLIFASLFTIFIINALYILILQITTPQKFQSIISYFQIFFAVFMYGSYQIIPRLLNKSTLNEVDISMYRWVWLAPPFWFASAWQSLSTFHLQASSFFAIALSLITPIASIYLVVKYFAPAFNQKLLLINTGRDTAILAKTTNKTTTSNYAETIAGWLTTKGAERMAFLFCWKMTGRSKDFKLKVYPSIGYIIVILLLPLITADNVNVSNVIASYEKSSFGFLALIYISSWLLMLAIQQMSYSDQHKAAWIYLSAPVQLPGLIIQGALKAAVIKFYIPIVFVVSTAAIIIAGPQLLPNLFLALINELFICSFITYVTVKELPFSMQQSNNLKAGSFMRGLYMLVVPAIVAVFHFLIFKITPVVYIFIALSAIATWLIQGSIRSISWKRITGKNESF
jgi:hypothetical protein